VTPNPMGTDGLWSYLVSKTDTLVMNTPGSEVFQPNGEGATDDVFEIVILLRQALDDQDFDAMATEEGRLREAISRVTGINAQVGSRINRLESISDDLETQILTYQDRRSQLQDTDLAEAIIEFNAADTAYQAALASTARILKLSLVDFI
jgi:flagellar hook-associated protein 3 FlgL